MVKQSVFIGFYFLLTPFLNWVLATFLSRLMEVEPACMEIYMVKKEFKTAESKICIMN
mgnify:CR=1 FL=1